MSVIREEVQYRRSWQIIVLNETLGFLDGYTSDSNAEIYKVVSSAN